MFQTNKVLNWLSKTFEQVDRDKLELIV